MSGVSFVAPLFVPADRPDRFEKAAASGADAIVVDLEDGVSEDRKSAARENLAKIGELSTPVVVRINSTRTVHFADDLRAVAEARANRVMIPKYESADEAHRVRDGIGRDVSLIPIIESAVGVLEAPAALRAQGILQAVFGSVDYAADLGCDHDDRALLFARSTMVLASRAAGISQPLDGATISFDRPNLAGDDARAARALGFGGKICIHPRQVEEVLEAFTPSDAEIAWAKQILATGGDGGATVVDGQMVDAPVLARARQLLARVRG